MPNHVHTVIKFKNLKSQSDIDFILHMIARPLTVGKDNGYVICFDKIIPEPETEEECPEAFIRSERKSHRTTWT